MTVECRVRYPMSFSREAVRDSWIKLAAGVDLKLGEGDVPLVGMYLDEGVHQLEEGAIVVCSYPPTFRDGRTYAVGKVTAKGLLYVGKVYGTGPEQLFDISDWQVTREPAGVMLAKVRGLLEEERHVMEMDLERFHRFVADIPKNPVLSAEVNAVRVWALGQEEHYSVLVEGVVKAACSMQGADYRPLEY